jgi:hypothetical protein
MVMELKNRLEERLTGLGEMTVQDLLPRLSTVGELVGFLNEIGAAAHGHEAPGQEERTA